MMTLLPIRRPRLAVSMTHDSLVLTTSPREWDLRRPGPRVSHLEARPLPAGLVIPSASALNIADVSVLAKELRTLIASRYGKRSLLPIALVVPDLCARVALFHFETWPAKSAEQGALLRFRFDNELHYAAASLRLVYRDFSSPRGPRHNEKGRSPGREVLAVAMRQDILAQYEAACVEAGCLPVRVGLSSFVVFERCRRWLERAIAQTSDEVFFVHAAPGSFFFLAYREHVPVYLRVKPMRHPHDLHQECRATLQFYEARRPETENPLRPRSLFLVGDACGLAQEVDEACQVSVQPIRWSDLGIRPKQAHLIGGLDEVRAFPAMASL